MKKLILCVALLVVVNAKAAQLADEPAVVNFFPEPRALKITFHPDQPNEQTEFERKRAASEVAQAEAKRDGERKMAAQEKEITPELVEITNLMSLAQIKKEQRLTGVLAHEQRARAKSEPVEPKMLLAQLAVNHQLRITAAAKKQQQGEETQRQAEKSAERTKREIRKKLKLCGVGKIKSSEELRAEYERARAEAEELKKAAAAKKLRTLESARGRRLTRDSKDDEKFNDQKERRKSE